MPSDVEKMTGLEHTEFMDIMSDYLYESIGAAEFAHRHPLIEKSCVVVPSTAHISFTKAVTILGLGKNSLIPVAVDEDSRMDAKGKLPQPKGADILFLKPEGFGLGYSLSAKMYTKQSN